MQRVPMSDTTAGALATALGLSSSTLQWASDFISLVMLLGNLFLVAGGVYLMWPRIKKRLKEAKEKRNA